MNMRVSPSTRRMCFTALGAVINVVCAFMAMTLHLPIYMDSVGTILVSTMLGARYGVAAGLTGSLLSGVLFDVYSFYYAPVQVFTAVMAAAVMRSSWGSGWRMLLSGVAVSLPTSLASACITAFVFQGQTAAASSYLVVLLHQAGMGLTLSCFVVQIVTEYLDKLTAMLLTQTALQKGVLPHYGKIQPYYQ